MKPKLPANIEASLAGLPQTQRTYALAKAMSECADAACEKEQKAACDTLNLTDPEPKLPDVRPITKEARDEWHTRWQAWHERNAALYNQLDDIAMRHQTVALRQTLRQAEDLLVEDVAERMQQEKPDAYHRIASAFDLWRNKKLSWENRQKLVEICFRCPPPKETQISGLTIDHDRIAFGLYEIICKTGKRGVIAAGMFPADMHRMLTGMLRQKFLDLATAQRKTLRSEQLDALVTEHTEKVRQAVFTAATNANAMLA